MTVSSQHDPAILFRRLERTSLLLVGHPDFPGKEEALGGCRADIDQRYHQGMLTDAQWTRLRTILSAESET